MPKEKPSDEALIDSYIADMHWRRLSAATIKTRRYYLLKFAREVGFRTATAERIQVWLDRPTLQPQTQNMWLTILNGFYVWAIKERGKTGIKTNPATKDEIVRPKSKKGTPHPIAERDLRRALDRADAQMRAWLLIGALEGFRCLEIVGLHREDVRDAAEPPELHIRSGKGNKSRDVPLHPDVAVALQRLDLPASGRLWPLLDSTKISRRINDYLRSLNCKNTKGEPATAHSLRHYFGTHTYRACLDLQLVADLMGHAGTAITSVYAAADHRKAAAVIGKLKVS